METFLRDLAVEQRKNNISNSVVVHNSDISFFSTKEVYRSDSEEFSVTRAARWVTLAFTPISPTFLWTLRSVIRREKPDLLHIHMPNVSAFWCLLLSDARRLPWIVQWQSDVVPSTHRLVLRMLYRFYKVPEKLLLSKAALIIASSPPYLLSSQALAPFRDKCVVVPLGVNNLSLTSMKQEPIAARAIQPVCNGPLRILTVCRLTYYKGIRFLIEALALTDNINLTLIGDGEERDNILQLIDQKNLQDRVTHLASCGETELQAHYLNHDLFCLPSIERTEAFGVVLLEAMRAGLACLVSDVPGSGMRWVVDAPKSGFVVPAGNAQALAETLRSLSDNRESIAKTAQCGLDRYNSTFTISQCNRSIGSIYQRALKMV